MKSSSHSKLNSIGLLGWFIACALSLLLITTKSPSHLPPHSLSSSSIASNNCIHSTTKIDSSSSNKQSASSSTTSNTSNTNKNNDNNTNTSTTIQRIFVVGCGHSGTSILLRSIGNMPGVRCIEKETALFKKNEGDDDSLQNELIQWDEMAKKGKFTSWVEKTPKHVHFLDKILEMDSHRKSTTHQIKHTKIVFIHRDGRDVALSFKARAYNWTTAVNRWVEDNQVALPFIQSGDALPVSFEKLTNSSTVLSTLRQISEFLNIQATDAELGMALMPGTKQHAYQEYCTSYTSDEEKAQDLADSLAGVLASKKAPLVDEIEEEGVNAEFEATGRKRGEKFVRHNAFRTWQMMQAWAEIVPPEERSWTEEEKNEFYRRDDAMKLMRFFGYIE